MGKTFQIEGFHVDPDANEILGLAGSIRLNPKAMHVLVLLADHAGQVVTKEELIDHVWQDVHVGDEVLTNAIYELRKAFSDDARHPRFIQTVHRSGYKLLPSVRWQLATEGARLRPRPIKWRRILIALGALAVVVASSWFLVSWTWPCDHTTRVHVTDHAQTPWSRQFEAFLRMGLPWTRLFELYAAEEPVEAGVLEIRLMPGVADLLRVEVHQDGVVSHLGADVPEDKSGFERLSVLVRKLAAESCRLGEEEERDYLRSGAFSLDVWHRVGEAQELFRRRRLKPTADMLDRALTLDEDDMYVLEQVARLNQILGGVTKARDQTRRALESAEKRGLGRRILLERRLAELDGNPEKSKELLKICLKEEDDESARETCVRKLAWHLNTYERRCNQSLGKYDDLMNEPRRSQEEPDLYLYRAEVAVACGELDEARQNIERFEQIEGRQSRDDAYAMWVWLELLTGRYGKAASRFDLLNLSGDFRSRARFFQAEIYRRRLDCDGAARLYLQLLGSERVSEKRDALDGLLQLSYECGRSIPDEATLELTRDDEDGPFYAPRAWAFLSLKSRYEPGNLSTMYKMATAAEFKNPVVCSPEEQERPNRRHEEWFCLAEAALATTEKRHDDAHKIHSHIENRLGPDDKALFRFHAGQAFEQAGLFGQAEDRYCEALEWNPCHVQSLAALDDVLRRNDRVSEARVAYDRAKDVVAEGDDVPLLEVIREGASSLGAFDPAETLCGRQVEDLISCSE